MSNTQTCQKRWLKSSVLVCKSTRGGDCVCACFRVGRGRLRAGEHLRLWRRFVQPRQPRAGPRTGKPVIFQPKHRSFSTKLINFEPEERVARLRGGVDAGWKHEQFSMKSIIFSMKSIIFSMKLSYEIAKIDGTRASPQLMARPQA